MTVTWTEEAIRALGVKTDVETVGSILGLSRTQAYRAIKDGRFPVQVIRVGRRMIVPTAPIRRLLGIDPETPAAEADDAPSARLLARVADSGSADAA